MKKIYFIFCLIVLFGFQKSNAQLLAWDFFNNTSTVASYNSTYNDPNIASSVLTRGAGAPSGGGYSYGFSMGFVPAATDLATAKTNNAYVEFKVLAADGYYMSLSDLDVKLRRHQNAAYMYRWTYRKTGQTEYVPLGSSDGNIGNYDSGNDQGVTQPTLDLSLVSDLQNVQPGDTVTFRLYAWGATSTTNAATAIGKSASSRAATSLMVRGTTSSAPIPVLPLALNEKIAAWSFPISAYEEDEIAASLISSNLTSANLTRGEGLAEANLNYGYVSTLSTVVNTLTEAEAANLYYTINLVTKPGYYTTLSTLIYRYRRLGPGPIYYQWKYAISNGTPVDIGTTGNFTSTLSEGIDYQLDLGGINALKNIAPGTNVSLMLYVWGDGGSATTASVTGFGRFGHATTTFHDIYLKGAVTETPLPVKLTSFTGKKENNGVKLSWSTSSEINNSHFEISRSANGNAAQVIGRVVTKATDGNGASYTFYDSYPLVGVNYYTLKQVDLDGKSETWAPIHVNFSLQNQPLKVFSSVQNPTTSLFLDLPSQQTGTLKIYNTNGTVLYQQTIKNSTENNVLSIPFNYSEGLYLAVVTLANGHTYSAKFIRQ